MKSNNDTAQDLILNSITLVIATYQYPYMWWYYYLKSLDTKKSS